MNVDESIYTLKKPTEGFVGKIPSLNTMIINGIYITHALESHLPRLLQVS